MAAEWKKIGAIPLVVAWLVTAGAMVAKALLTAGTTPLLLDTDDAMRLNEVHDFLAGQGWFDLVQHRMNTPFGALMHWSRLIDLPEAIVLAGLRPLAGAMADTVAAYVWPLLLIVPLLWLTAKIAIRLGGLEARWPALLLPLFSLVTLSEFAPGRFDHHSAQILLTLAALGALIAALDRPRFATIAGVAMAAAITIGIEGLPMAVAVAGVFALMWIADRRHAAALRDFGLSFALATALGLAQGVPPPDWLALRLDAISVVYVLAATLCGLGFLLLSLMRIEVRGWRLVAAVVIAAVIVAILLLVDPAIPRGPYAALDPWLLQHWLPAISEAQSWTQSFRDDPLFPASVTVPVLVALVVSIWNAVRRPADRGAWLISAAPLLAGLVVMFVQIRASRIVTPLAVPACAALVAGAWRWSRRSGGLLPAFAVFASALVSMGLVTAVLVALLPAASSLDRSDSGNRNACLMPQAFADLAKLPPQAVMAPIDLGSHLLLFTADSVVGAPYHRNQQGVLDTFRFFNSPLDEARAILDARGTRLVVICPAMREIRGLVDHAPDSFVTLYAEHALPVWLVAQSPPAAPLQIYAVAPR